MFQASVLVCLLFVFLSFNAEAWIPLTNVISLKTSSRRTTYYTAASFAPLHVKTNVEETAEKYGLEVGLAESLTKKDGGESAKALLKRYGIAYLATSIPLAIVSFALCYFLVDNGVDVGALLGKIGIENNDVGEKAGTFALAYAAHKAASPIRFPPTVVLTPIVAKFIGKEPNDDYDVSETNAAKK